MAIDVTHTVEVLHEMARDMRRGADNLERISNVMNSRKDLGYCMEALTEIRDVYSNLRIDLLFTRPQREYEREIDRLAEGREDI